MTDHARIREAVQQLDVEWNEIAPKIAIEIARRKEAEARCKDEIARREAAEKGAELKRS